MTDAAASSRGKAVNKSSAEVLSVIAFTLALLIAPTAFPQAQSQTTGSEGEALYMQIHRVLVHPRCLNCHPKGDSPKQGDVRQIHMPPITRGPHDHGPPGLQCAACHQTMNYSASGTPGAPGWHLAPRSQAWEGKTPGELCRLLVNRRSNGNKSLAEIVKHLTEDELVAWGWTPGKDIAGKEREPVPLAKPEFDRVVHAWAKTGAVCPQ
jgi:hypothetical protein